MFPNRLLKFIILVLPLILTGIFSGCGGITTPGISQDTLSALITANTTSGEAPLEVIFVASESFAAQGNEIVSYEWDFGDGNTGKGQTIQYSFDSPGNYTILLTINDNKGAVDTSSVIITVFHPTETVIEQNFNTQNGTEFDTGTGLRVYVPPSLSAEEVKLIVKYYSNPPQINDCIGNLFSAYSINMIYEKESQRQKLRPLRESFELIKLTFDIPEEEDIRSVLIVNKTDEGWVIAENKEGPYGGTISEDGEKILISLEYSSDYALSTPAVLTYNQQDMQELLSELEAQNAVIESAPPVIPNYKGTIIIPKEDFPEGEGTAIPIHIPPYKYSSNANMEEEGWKKKWEKIIRVTMKNWWALLATFEPGGVPLTPADAAVVFFEALVSASSNVNEIYDIAITIQENKNTAGNLRAIIQLGDPESVQWQRRLAGDKEAIGGSLCIYNICIGAFPGYLEVQNLCEKIGLPFEPSYFLQLESDKQHEYDKYIGYLSVNENNALVLIPKIYSDDQMAIWHFEKFLKPVLDIEIPILNSYRFSEDLETAILKELSPIQVGLESTQPNIIPVAKPDPPTPLSPGTTSSPGPTIDTLTPFLQWQTVSNADYYNLAISEYPYGTTNIIYNPQQISGSSITVPSGKLEIGKKYRWNMRAHNSTGFSDYSITLYFQTGLITCTSPGSFTLIATPECNGITSQIRLNWTNSSGVSSYDVYRNSTLYYSGLTGTQFINSGNITAGTSYSYYILAKNSCDSTTSNIVSATAINCDSTVSARIDSYSPSSKITINTGQSFIISTSFTNTGNTAAYFYAGVSIWDSNGNVIFNGWGGKTYLNKGQQGSASWNHTINTPGEYWLQFGVWNEAKSELLDKKPSPSQNLIKVFSLSSQTERLTNGSFSSGTSGWNLVGDFWAGTNFSNYRTPPGYAAGGVNSAGLPINNAVGYMYQTVNIPSGATSATLSFWYNVTSEETGSTVYDVLNVTIKNSTGNYLATVAVLSNLNKSSLGSYSKVTFDVTPYKGQTIRVHFLATTDSSVFTVFRIDDISLMSDG